MPKAVAKPPLVPSNTPDGTEKPVQTIRNGMARGQIWKTDDNGRTIFSFTVDRCVTDKAGNSQVGQTFLAEDVRHLIKVTTEAAKWIEWQQKRLAELAQSAQ